MEPNKSIEIIDSMLKIARKSYHRVAFYFILWGVLLSIAGIVEYVLWGNKANWIVWPIVGILGGIISGIYGRKESSKTSINTNVDSLMQIAWLSFGAVLLFLISYALFHNILPHSLILIQAGFTTFVSGSIIKFKPLNYGGIALALGAVVCGFITEPMYSGLVFAISLTVGYVLPGLKLRGLENE